MTNHKLCNLPIRLWERLYVRIWNGEYKDFNELADWLKGMGYEITPCALSQFEESLPTFRMLTTRKSTAKALGGASRKQRIPLIFDILGHDKAMVLISEYRGTRVYIPATKNLKESHPLAELLGIDDARKLSDHFRCELIKIPTGGNLERHLRDSHILNRYANGETAAKLALEFRMTEDSIYRLIKREKERRAYEQPTKPA